MGTLAIDLTDNTDVTKSIRIGDKTTLGCNTVLDSGNWGSAVVEVQQSIDDAIWSVFSPVVEMSSGTPTIINRGIYGSLFLRFKTKTSDGGADATATINYSLLP